MYHLLPTLLFTSLMLMSECSAFVVNKYSRSSPIGNSPILSSSSRTRTQNYKDKKTKLFYIFDTEQEASQAEQELTLPSISSTAVQQLHQHKQLKIHIARKTNTFVWDEKQWRKALPTLKQAFWTLKDGGVLLVPTNVGYTLMALPGFGGIHGFGGTEKMMDLKGRPDDKPCGVMAIPPVYKDIFDVETPDLMNEFCTVSEEGRTTFTTCPEEIMSDFCLSFLGKPVTPRDKLERLVSPNAIGPKGEVGCWLNLGPVHDYLARRAYSELGEVIIGTSANIAGQGNPNGDTYCVDAVDPAIISAVDYVVDVSHWSKPEFDAQGSWLSAPIFDFDEHNFRRIGKHMEIAEIIVSDFL